MKQNLSRLLFAAVKIVSIFIVSGCICIFTLALKLRSVTDDLWKQLGIPQADVNTNIQVSIGSGYLQYNGAKNAKNIVAASRVAVINELVAYAKKYTSSKEFKQEYAQRRSTMIPKKPVLSRINVDSIRAAEKHSLEESIKQTQANANSPNPKIRNGVPARLDALNKQLQDLDKPDNPVVQRKVKDMQQINDLYSQDYTDKMNALDKKYPENPQVLIKRRLQEILDITADVDYDAQIDHGKKYDVFVNPAYEKKSKDWKLAFRAGKTATDAVRAAAQKWIMEIK